MNSNKVLAPEFARWRHERPQAPRLRHGDSPLGEWLFRSAVLALAAGLALVLARLAMDAQIPERMFQALAFGGAMVLVLAAWRALELRETAGLMASAAVVVGIVLSGPASLALFASGAGAIVASMVTGPRLFFDGWAWFNFVLGALALGH